MKHKYKLTGFARLFIFLAFFLPLTFLGLSIYKGEIKIDSLFEDIKNKFTSEKTITQDENCSELLQLKDKEIQLLRERIQTLERS